MRTFLDQTVDWKNRNIPLFQEANAGSTVGNQRRGSPVWASGRPGTGTPGTQYYGSRSRFEQLAPRGHNATRWPKIP